MLELKIERHYPIWICDTRGTDFLVIEQKGKEFLITGSILEIPGVKEGFISCGLLVE